MYSTHNEGKSVFAKRCIKILKRPADVKSSAYIDFEVKSNNKDRQFEVDDHVRTSKYFCKTLHSKLI